MKTTSRFALAAAAGLFVGGIAFTPANAADLGGDCCADLEERVAELEATTARKGNRKVSLEISGQVNRALLVWDDGDDSDAFVVDNAYSSSRFRFKGEAKMKPGWKAGFLIELQVNDAGSNNVTQDDDEGNGEAVLSTRHTALWVESEKLGRVTIGQTSSATDDLILISLADTGGFTSLDTLYIGGFIGTESGASFGTLTGNSNGVALDTNRGDFIRYDTPSIYGFILTAAWGENDVWDIALRFKKEWNSIRIAAGVGYYWNGDSAPSLAGAALGDEVEEFKGSASVMHVPTGLFITGAFVERERSNFDQESSAYYVQAGIEKKFFPHGATTIYGEYGVYDDFAAGIGGVLGSEVDRYGFGVAQTFDSAALQLYAAFQFYDAESTEIVNEALVKNDDEISVGVVGARIKF